MKLNKNLIIEVLIFYYPEAWLLRVEWLRNFAGKIVGYAGDIPCDPTVAAARAADCLYLAAIVELVIQRDIAQQRLVQFRNTLADAKDGAPLDPLSAYTPPVLPPAVPAGVHERLFAFVKSIDVPTTPETIKKDLQIIDTPTTIDLNHESIDVKAVTSDENGVYITFRKHYFDGIVVYESKDGGETFVEGEKFKFSPAKITKKNATTEPEIRLYKFKGTYKDQVAGLFSPEFGVVAKVF